MANLKNNAEILGLRCNVSNEIAKKLSSIRDRDYYSVLGDFFEASAISVKNAVDCNERDVYEKRYGDIARSYGKAWMDIFAECLGLFMAEIHAAMEGSAMFRDFAGELYMASGTNSKGLGQFFTPYHVSRLMAECNVEKERFAAEIENDPDRVITFYEPTCGAGGLMVAAIDVMHSAGINYAHNMFIDCGDIDPRCFHMSYLTLSLLGAPAVVRPTSSTGRISRAGLAEGTTRKHRQCQVTKKTKHGQKKTLQLLRYKQKNLLRTSTGSFHFSNGEITMQTIEEAL